MATINDRGTVQIATRVPPDVAERLEKIAEENERSMAAELRRLVRQYVSDQQEEVAARPA